MARQPPKIALITQSFFAFLSHLTVLVGQYLFWIRAGIGRMHSVSSYSTLIIVPTMALAGLFWAARREGGRPIAQVLAPVIGAILGVCGVFLETQLQFAHQTEQLQEDTHILNSWLSGDVRSIFSQVEASLMGLMMTNLPDG